MKAEFPMSSFLYLLGKRNEGPAVHLGQKNCVEVFPLSLAPKSANTSLEHEPGGSQRGIVELFTTLLTA